MEVRAVGLVYDLNNLQLLRKSSYSGEGWGLTPNGHQLFMSDGTSPVDQLNEPEFVEGRIFANVWHSNLVAQISPQTGTVVGWIDLSGILSPVYRFEPGAVLNGIAYDSLHKRLFVTARLWPSIFEIRLTPEGSR